ncbi:uncharacterized protein LOC127283264 [Leptopilina boulardi]|uniref:uncharacterized protein LOC127282924 n=1 Tax=Leptopilina boulardi TaxID=63433 RepID=UPI0021F691E9|nr:uncharacterized protein LOC127282924 [Leptopilina boulardi]XP_051163961.1 uncharacterized protein LOC127283264 [Leptopilina boulardi]
MDNDFVWNNFRYHIRSSTDTQTYYVCVNRKSKKCQGRGVLKNGVFNVTHTHNHLVDKKDIKIRAFKQALHNRVTTSSDKYRKIYDEVRLHHADAAQHLPFSKIENTMFQWRKKVTPPTVNNLNNFVEVANSDEWKDISKYNGGNLEISLAIAEDGSRSTIFCDKNFVNEVYDNQTMVFIDATFKIVPPNMELGQFLTLMTVKYNHTIPFVWILMEKRTAAAYEAVFEELKILFPNFHIMEAMCDFEAALKLALRNKFNGISIHGCFFHFNQALYRKVGVLNLENILFHTAEGYNFLRQLMALPLLPANEVRGTYVTILNLMPLNIKNQIQSYTKYFQRQWLRKVTPEVFSCFGLERRTNNCLESYHKQLKQKFGIRPKIWHFTKLLVNFQEGLQIDLGALKRGHQITRNPKLHTVIKNALIEEQWNKFQTENRPTALEFIDKMILICINPIYEFLNAEEADG